MSAARPRPDGSPSRSTGPETARSRALAPSAISPAIGCPRACALGVAGPAGRLSRHLADAFERGDTLAGDRLELRAELGRVVGDQVRAVPGAADLHVEALLRGEVRVPGLDRGDHVVDRAPLERMHGGRPGVVEVPELRVARAQVEPASVLQAERDAPVRDAHAPRRCGC